MRGVLLGCLMLLLVSPAVAQDKEKAKQPKAEAKKKPDGEKKKKDDPEKWAKQTEDQPFPLDDPAREGAAKAQSKRMSEQSLGWLLFQVVAYLCLVILLLYVTAWLFKRFLPGRARMLDHPGVVVLGRTYLAPKQLVYLVKVGAQVLVLGVSGEQMTTLSVITDPEEVAVLERMSKAAEKGNIAQGFKGLLKGAIKDFEKTDAPQQTTS